MSVSDIFLHKKQDLLRPSLFLFILVRLQLINYSCEFVFAVSEKDESEKGQVQPKT